MNNINKLKVLHMSDATDVSGGAEEVDPLSQAAGGVDTSFPLLAGDRIGRFKIVKSTIAIKKGDEDAENPRKVWTIKLKTEKEMALNNGKTAKAGFTSYKRVSVTPSEGGEGKEPRTSKDIARDIALGLKAIGKPELTPRQVLDNPEIFNDQIVDMKIGISPANGSFPESNTFSFVLPA